MPLLYQSDPPVSPDFAPRIAVQDLAETIRQRGMKGELIAQGFEQVGEAFGRLVEGLTNTVNGRFGEVLVTDSATDSIVGWIGTRDGYEGGWFRNLYVGGAGPDSAPFVADVNGRVTLALGATDDQAFIEVLDSGNLRVVWMGRDNGYYGLATENLWVGPGANPTTAVLWSDGTGTFIGKNGFISLLDSSGAENAWIGARTIGASAFAGGWAREWRIGGNDTGSAVIIADLNGDVSIAGGDVYLGPGPNGLGGRLFSYTGNTLTGWIGSGDVATPVAVTGIAGGTVTTSAAHGLLAGDYTFLDGTSLAAHNNQAVQVATVPFATTFTVTGLTGSSTGGTSTKQLTGAWFQEVRAGGAGPLSAYLIANSSGLDILNADITISQGDTLIAINGTDGLKITDTVDGTYAQIRDGAVTVTNGIARSQIGAISFETRYAVGAARISGTASSGASVFQMYDSTGTLRVTIQADSVNGFANFQSLRVAGSVIVDSALNAAVGSLTVGGVPIGSMAFKNSSDYYTAAQVDTLLLGYAQAVHSHTNITITGTSGTVAHTHSGNVS